MQSTKKLAGEWTKPEVGETVFLRNSDSFIFPNPLGLYLGFDSKSEKILAMSYVSEFELINVDSLDQNDYRAMGGCNTNKVSDKMYEYTFYQDKTPIVVTVELREEEWKITTIKR